MWMATTRFRANTWAAPGLPRNGSWWNGYVGLQVIALGDGQFDAVLYTGGLPGAGWDRSEKTKLSGKLEGNVVRLEQGPTVIEVDGTSALITYPGYSPRSRITKILRGSPTSGKRPPREAIVLFDGTNSDLFKNGKISDDGLLMEGTETRDAYSDFSLHIEFRLPYMPYARGQGRANSGVYLQSRYEVQVLDSFGLEGVHNECGGLYKQRRPDLNMCFPPLRWQTYDLKLTAAKFDTDGKKTQNARLTVLHNGVLIHNDVELTNKTGAGRPEGPEALPTKLQNHGNPVRFRNIWLVEGDADIVGDSDASGRLAQQQGRMSSGSQGTRRTGRGTATDSRTRRLPDYRQRPSVYYGGPDLHPRPLHQYRHMEYNPTSRRYEPIRRYAPIPPDRRGYWTW